jgi:nucleotide-binding universal stress UspA family protein
MKLKRILVPTDFSAHSARALEHAVDLAKRFEARLIVLHSLEPIHLAAPADLYGSAPTLTTLMEGERRCAKEELARIGGRLQKRGVAVRTVLASGTPHAAIVEAVAQLDADLIVMATHGRSGLSHLFIGSVAEKVVRAAPCPVLTVRGEEDGRRRGATKRPKRS